MWHFHQAREKAIEAFAKAGKHVKQVDSIKFVLLGSVFSHCLTCFNHSPAPIFLTGWNGAGQKSHTYRRSEGSGVRGAESEALSAEQRAPSPAVGTQSGLSTLKVVHVAVLQQDHLSLWFLRPPRASIAETAGPARFAGQGVSCEAWAFPSKGVRKDNLESHITGVLARHKGGRQVATTSAGCIVRGDVAAAQQHVRDQQGLLHGGLEAHVWAINEYGYDPEYWQG